MKVWRQQPTHSGAGTGANAHEIPPHTHLSYFSRRDLPFVGAPEHTGDVPVGKQGGLVSVPPGSLASRAGAGWLLDTHPWLACTQT